MILDPKKTTVAYRCPSCGAGVMSVVSPFNLKADMIKLKCDCGNSEMKLIFKSDSKVQITVPCMLCPNPHNYTVANSLFFKEDIFILSCPYADLNLAMTGDINQVKAELAKGELQLLELVEQSTAKAIGVYNSMFNYNTYANPEIKEAITSMIYELDDEGKIECDCTPDSEGDYELTFGFETAELKCKKCNCIKTFSTDSLMEVNRLIGLDKLKLE